MKAAVYEGIDKITVKDIPMPVCDENSMILKVEACAVCGSDIRIYHSGNSRVNPPQVIGHEISGIIHEVGANVVGFSVGDRVAMGADVPCGHCPACKAGMGNNCVINYAMGYQFSGGFQEYVLLNSTVVNYGPITKIPDHLSYEEAALAEPLACVLNAMELSDIRMGDTVVVMGAGPIGLMILDMAKRVGAAKTILVQRSRPRLELAQKLGVADVYICTNEEDGIARVLEETDGLGADVIMTANPSPQSQADALLMAKNRARVNFFGGLPADKAMVTLNTNIIHYKELFVMGAHGSTPVQHEKAVKLIASGVIDMKKYMSHTFPLSEIHKAIEMAEGHGGLRVVVKP